MGAVQWVRSVIFNIQMYLVMAIMAFFFSCRWRCSIASGPIVG